MYKRIGKLFFLCIALIVTLVACAPNNNENKETYNLDEANTTINPKEKEQSAQDEKNNSLTEEQHQNNKIKRLKELDPISDIKTKEDIYPVVPEIYVLKQEEEKKTIWDVGSSDVRSGKYFRLTRDEDNDLYISRYNKELQPKDGFNIKAYLDDENINISDILVEVLDVTWGNDCLIFKIDDGNSGQLFISWWDGDKHLETSPLCTGPLQEYNITKAAVISNEEDTVTEDLVYNYVENDMNYLIIKDKQSNNFIQYALPEEIKEIKALYTYDDLKDIRFSRIQKEKIYIKAVTTTEDYTVSYEIDLVSETIRKYNNVKNLREMFTTEWTFTGDLENNIMLECVADVALLDGDDGLISGYHDHEYLYGVDLKSGKKLWSVYGSYQGMSYYLSRDKNYIIIATYYDKRIQCLDIHMGKIVWDKYFGDKKHITNIISVEDEVAISLDEEGKDKIMTLNQQTGDLLWEKSFDKSFEMFSEIQYVPLVICVDDNGMTAYESKTGNEHWKIKDSLKPNYYIGGVGREPSIVRDLMYWEEENRNSKQWFHFDESFKNIDLNNGKILDVINDTEGALFLLNDKYTIFKSLSDKKGFSLYSNIEKKMLWSKDEELVSVTAYDNKLYYITDSKIKCVTLSTGETLWQNEFPNTVKDSKYREINKPVVVKDQLHIMYDNIIFAFDSTTGGFLYQVGDCYIQDGFRMTERGHNYYYTLRLDENRLFIGRKDGYLDLMKVD